MLTFEKVQEIFADYLTAEWCDFAGYGIFD